MTTFKPQVGAVKSGQIIGGLNEISPKIIFEI